MNIEKYLSDFRRSIAGDNRGEPDCYLIYKTDECCVVGEPLAIFRKYSALADNFQKISDKVDARWGICVGCWWFDDIEHDTRMEGLENIPQKNMKIITVEKCGSCPHLVMYHDRTRNDNPAYCCDQLTMDDKITDLERIYVKCPLKDASV